MKVSNIKIKAPKDKLEEIYTKLNDRSFGIAEDIQLYNDANKKMLEHFPEKTPFFDCLYMELMEYLGIKK